MQNNSATLIILAIFVAMGLAVAVVAIVYLNVEAAGCNRSVPYNASKGRCFGH